MEWVGVWQDQLVIVPMFLGDMLAPWPTGWGTHMQNEQKIIIIDEFYEM